MSHRPPLPKACPPRKATPGCRSIASRPGITTIEIFVSLTLIATGLTVSATLIVQHARLLMAQRQERLALDELSNQIERLTALPAGELPAALANLHPSDVAAAHLPDVQLRGQLESAEPAQRLTLEITWGNRPAAAPLALSAWLVADEEAP